MNRGIRQRLRDTAEGAAAHLVFRLFAVLPLDAASGLGAWLFRTLGPRLGLSRRAHRNLGLAFPEKSPAEIEAVVRGMWDNLGRNLGEFPHIEKIVTTRMQVVGAEILDRLRDDGRPGVFFSGHLANWETMGGILGHNGLRPHLFYRAANNPWVELLYVRARSGFAAGLLPKGSRGARQALALLGKGEHLGMLVDQKMNDGIAVPFFGRPAMTAPALAQLALRFDCPMVPMCVERLAGAHFRATVMPPLTPPRSGDRQADILAVMTEVNALIEDWIRARPEQWLWLHRRWPD